MHYTDYASFLPSAYELRVAENLGVDSATSLTVQASDPDSGDRLTYGIIDDSNTFSIDSRSGQVKLKARLDFETKRYLSFVVTVTDAAGHISNATVHVNVTDVNDNEPQFITFPSPANVSENVEKNTQVAEIVANDRDSGSFGQLSFRLLNAASLGGKFVLNSTGPGRVSLTVK